MNIMKVLLIQPDYPKDYRYGPKNMIMFPPLGLECIAGNLMDLTEVKIFDHRIYNKRELEKILTNYNPDYVGISCNFSTQIYHVNALAKLAKEYGSKTIVGGWHPTLVPDETLKSPWIDIIVRSEGEITFRELIQNNGPNGIRGISYKNGKKIIHNPDREPLELIKINPPARFLRTKKAKKMYNFFGLPADLMETSRGCPFRCKFCIIHVFYQKKYRVKRIKDIIKEMKEINKYSKFLYIIDDNFMVYKEHVSNLCDAIIKSKLNMFYMTTARIDMVNKYPEIFEKMAKAGFIFLFIGLESFSNKALKNLNKHYKFQEIKRAIKILHDLGFIIQGNIILGADFNETVQDIKTTIEMTKTLEVDLPTFSLMVPYPKTEIREYVEKNNMLINTNWKSYNWFTPLIKYPNISPDEMQDLINEAYSKTNFLPYPLKTINRIYKSRGTSFFISRLLTKRFIISALKSVQFQISNYLRAK